MTKAPRKVVIAAGTLIALIAAGMPALIVAGTLIA
jgi:hypothetical protein